MGELERQVERGSLFVHSALTEQTVRANENEALVNGLVDVLVKHKFVDADELLAAVESAREETAEAGQLATVGVAIRVDNGDEPSIPVDCESRLPICRAVCCRLQFALSVSEIESGTVKWDLGRPYHNRRDADGYCTHSDTETRGCHVYDDRPTVCRRYSCAGDPRIWTDFEARELNQDWIDANLGGDEPGPVEIYMNAYAG